MATLWDDLPDWEQDAIEQVIKASRPVFLTTKAEEVAYFRKQSEGKRGKESWKQQLTSQLAEITGMKQKNLERRFDPSRLDHVPRTAKEKQQYIDLGQKLGPVGRKPPENGYHVSFDGWIRFSECGYWPFQINITGKIAAEVCKAPELIIDAMLRIWMEQENEDEASIGICTKGEKDKYGNEVRDPIIKIRANADDQKVVDDRKHHKSARPKKDVAGVPFFKKKVLV